MTGWIMDICDTCNRPTDRYIEDGIYIREYICTHCGYICHQEALHVFHNPTISDIEVSSE